MIAILVSRMNKFPSEFEALEYGELQFTYASLIYDAELKEKRRIELARTRDNTPPKIFTARS